MVLSGVVALATLQEGKKARRPSRQSPSLLLDLDARAPLNVASIRMRSSLDDEKHLFCAERVRPSMNPRRSTDSASWKEREGATCAPAPLARIDSKEVGSMAEKEKDRKDHKKDGKDGGKK